MSGFNRAESIIDSGYFHYRAHRGQLVFYTEFIYCFYCFRYMFAHSRVTCSECDNLKFGCN